MNVKQSTIDACTELIGQCFKENRVFDRLVSVLGVKFAMNNTSNLCHLGISHMFPILADKIGEECLERYNIDVKYSATPEAVDDYSSPQEIIKIMEDEVVNFQNMFIKCCEISKDNDDLHVYTDLLSLLKDYNKTVEQCILLVDKCELYKDNMAAYDAHIKDHFWIL